MEPGARLSGLVVLLGVILILAVKFLLPLAAPFLIGLLLASLLEPLVRWCETRCGLPRWLAAGGVLAAALALAGLVLVDLVIRLWFGLRQLAASAARGGALFRLVERIAGAGTAALADLPEPIRGTLLAGVRRLPDGLAQFLTRLAEGLGRLPEWLLVILLGMTAAYFISRDRETLRRWLLGAVPREWRSRAAGMKDDLLRALAGFVRAQFLLGGLTMATGVLGLAVLRAGQPVLLGLVLGLLDLLPVIGPGALLLPWAGVCLVQGDWGRAAGLTVLFAVLAIGRELAEARLIGRNMGLHPLAALASVYLGLRLIGPVGLLFGPLILVVLRATYGALSLPGGTRERGSHETARHCGLDRFHRAPGA